jgi:hypothetical protein
MFSLRKDEAAALRSQIATSNAGRGGRRYVQMLSGRPVRDYVFRLSIKASQASSVSGSGSSSQQSTAEKQKGFAVASMSISTPAEESG